MTKWSQHVLLSADIVTPAKLKAIQFKSMFYRAFSDIWGFFNQEWECAQVWKCEWQKEKHRVWEEQRKKEIQSVYKCTSACIHCKCPHKIVNRHTWSNNLIVVTSITFQPLSDKSLSPPILPCRFIALSPCCNKVPVLLNLPQEQIFTLIYHTEHRIYLSCHLT